MKEVTVKVKKKTKGFLKPCVQPGTSKIGYQDLWEMGRVSDKKKRGKVTGINRPST